MIIPVPIGFDCPSSQLFRSSPTASTISHHIIMSPLHFFDNHSLYTDGVIGHITRHAPKHGGRRQNGESIVPLGLVVRVVWRDGGGLQSRKSACLALVRRLLPAVSSGASRSTHNLYTNPPAAPQTRLVPVHLMGGWQGGVGMPIRPLQVAGFTGRSTKPTPSLCTHTFHHVHSIHRSTTASWLRAERALCRLPAVPLLSPHKLAASLPVGLPPRQPPRVAPP